MTLVFLLQTQVHVNHVVSRAHKRAAVILRAFVSRDLNLMRAFLVYVYVRRIVDYNTIIWLPSAARDIDALESFQRRFTKQLPDLKYLPYCERLNMCPALNYDIVILSYLGL